ncbi:unnamed protein product [Rhizophagus irregularis]|uniref:Uncharacterized protein n=1 Tax=Rhizophagus irregularis TaxID=588596 RepID=A0A915Z917_9GLOM|nr:unnamed protein product [Rhizophagus irregularis]
MLDYGFQIPHAAITLLSIDNITPVTEAIDTIASPTTDIPIPSEEGMTWHLKLGILIEDELFPYVPTGPIYKTRNCRKRGKDPLTPGSKPWLQAVKNHRAFILEKNNINELQQQYKEKAKLWNTSENRYQFREDKVKCLMRFQHHYHKSINKLIDRRDTLNDKLNKGIKKGKTTKQLQQLE